MAAEEIKDFLLDFLLGGVSALIAKTATAPIERIKLILQTQDSNPEIMRTGNRYKGIGDCFMRVVKDEGILKLWRGNGANLLRYFPTQAINFACKEQFQEMFIPEDQTGVSFWKLLGGNLLAGGLAGASSMIVVYPMDLVRTRLAADIGASHQEFKGIWDCMSKLYNAGGTTELYRGFSFSVVGIFFYRAAYFGLYDSTKPLISDNLIAKLSLAQLVSTTSGLLAYPFDTVRRRLMMQSGKSSKEIQYKNPLHCTKEIFKQEGFQGFMKGALSNVFRGVGSSLVLVLYDELHEYFLPEPLIAPKVKKMKKKMMQSPADGNEHAKK